MRIDCAKCGEMHNSAMTPFKYDKVSKVATNVEGDHEALTKFICKHCGIINYVKLTWYAQVYCAISRRIN
jgi:hypothetical protein